MLGLPITTNAVTTARTATAANDAVITIAAVTGHTHVIDWLTISYSKVVAVAANCTVAVDGTTIWSCGIAANAAEELQVKHFVFPHGLYGGVGLEVVITLGGGGGTSVATACCGYR